jgi:hypothetical protein
LVASVSATLGWVFRSGMENNKIQLRDELTMTEKLLSDKADQLFQLAEKIEARMGRRIKALERDKRELQDLFTTQFHRTDETARDHRRMNWLENNPSMIDHFEGYWYYGDNANRFNSFREVIDAAMKAPKGNT